MTLAAAPGQGSSASQTKPPDQSNKTLASCARATVSAIFGPAVGATEIFQMIFSRGQASGATSRMARQSVWDAGASSRAIGAKSFSINSSWSRRPATEGAKPSRRNAVIEVENPWVLAANGGKCAAPDTSAGAPIAAQSAFTAGAGSRPVSINVAEVSPRGSTFKVTSVATARVPNEPASTRERS